MKKESEGKNLDRILFTMLGNVEKGIPFNNVIKGDFQIEVTFGNISLLKATQALIE
jgi:hypothetical protein